MAVTYIRSVRTDPSRTIRYAADPEKTLGMRELVSGINCIPELAQAQFAQTSRWWGKEDGVRCYHLYQSFQEGETMPEEANRIGKELAEAIWGDRFEAVVATHCNTGAVHNHIVVNAVSFRDGKKFNNSKEVYPSIRRESDRICREHGLSVVRDPRGRRANWQERQAEKMGLPTIRQTVRNDIDAAVASSRTWNAFRKFLTDRGYEFSDPETDEQNGRGPGLRPRGASGYFRFASLGKEYGPEEIRERILSDIEYVPHRQTPAKALPEIRGTMPLETYISYLEKAFRDPASCGIITLDMRKDMTRIAAYRKILQGLQQRGITDSYRLSADKQRINEELSSLSAADRASGRDRELREQLRQTEKAEQAMELAQQRIREASELQKQQDTAGRQREEDRWHTHRTQPSRW